MVGRMPACSFHAGFALSAMLSEGPEVVVKLAEPIEIFDLQGVF